MVANRHLIVLLAFGAFAPSLHAADPRVVVCHETGNGRIEELRVAHSALTSHLRHGDSLPREFHLDADGDGAGDPDLSMWACEAPLHHVADASDCDDGDAALRPGALDLCGDGIDQDCSGDDALCASELDGWTIQSRHVTHDAEAGTVASSFELSRLFGTATGRGGGACLVADLVDRGVGAASCTTDAECVIPAAWQGRGWFGYCASPDGSGEAKRCWTRPGGPLTHCRRSAELLPTRQFSEGVYTLTPVRADAAEDGAPVRWMLLACLAGERTPASCGGTDPSLYVRSNGPVTTTR